MAANNFIEQNKVLVSHDGETYKPMICSSEFTGKPTVTYKGVNEQGIAIFESKQGALIQAVYEDWMKGKEGDEFEYKIGFE